MSVKQEDAYYCDYRHCQNRWFLGSERAGSECYLCHEHFCQNHLPLVRITIKVEGMEYAHTMTSLCKKCAEALVGLLDEQRSDVFTKLRATVYQLIGDSSKRFRRAGDESQ